MFKKFYDFAKCFYQFHKIVEITYINGKINFWHCEVWIYQFAYWKERKHRLLGLTSAKVFVVKMIRECVKGILHVLKFYRA